MTLPRGSTPGAVTTRDSGVRTGGSAIGVPGGIVACDDTWVLPSVLDPTPAPGWNGKGGAAVPYLLGRGFTVIDQGDIHHGRVIMRRE